MGGKWQCSESQALPMCLCLAVVPSALVMVGDWEWWHYLFFSLPLNLLPFLFFMSDTLPLMRITPWMRHLFREFWKELPWFPVSAVHWCPMVSLPNRQKWWSQCDETQAQHQQLSLPSRKSSRQGKATFCASWSCLYSGKSRMEMTRIHWKSPC